VLSATLHQLVVFEATARHASFTRAAEELSITQPTVSTQIKQLAKAIGSPLFEQIGKRLYLTEAGQHLLLTCHNIFDRLENFEMAVAALKGTKQGRLKLVTVTTAQYFIPRILGNFCQQYPGIDISLEITNHQQLQKRMMANEGDLYIMSQPPEDLALQTQPFLDNPLVVVARQDHPLAGQKNIPIARLENEPFILREAGSGTRRAVQHLFARQGIALSVRLEISNNEAIKQAIAGGLGISVLSRHVFNPEGVHGEFTILDVQHFPLQQRWYVAHLSGKELSVIARTFLEYLFSESHQNHHFSSTMLLSA
jgi:DNA-binding transcriptional LysR family regulator